MEERLSERVYQCILHEIIEGTITVDSAFTEAELAQKYNVSRSPIREALYQLCAEGVLKSTPRVGYRITVTTPRYLQEVIRYRRTLECGYLSDYFDQIREDDIKKLRESIQGFDGKSMENPLEYWGATMHFHLALAEIYQNQFYYESLKRLLIRQHVIFASLYWQRWGLVSTAKCEDKHSKIIDAIEKKDKNLAVALLKQDIDSF